MMIGKLQTVDVSIPHQETDQIQNPLAVGPECLAGLLERRRAEDNHAAVDEMAKYLRVLEEANAHSAVLPAPPGTVFQSQSILTRWLELHYFTLTEALAVVEGHAAARVSITTQSRPDDGEAQKSFAALAAESLKMLRGQAAATVTLPKAVGDEEDGVVARASFLIDSQRWQTFKDTVSKEAQRQTALDFQVTGPWPPYDFVRMQFRA